MMEQAQSGAIPVWTIKLLAGVVTANVLISIAEGWKGFDLLGKFLAVVLLANIVALPVAVTWGRIKRYDWQSLFPAYMWLLLATLLFGLR